MKLSRQLTLVSLVMLLLPWAGYQYLGQMSRAMMEGVASAQTARAQAVISYLQSRPQLFLPLLNPVGGNRVFFPQSGEPPLVDAELNEWDLVVDEAGNMEPDRAAFLRVRDTLYLAIDIVNDSPEVADQGLHIYTRDQRYPLQFMADGNVVALSGDPQEFRLLEGVLGKWRAQNGSYLIEVGFPAAITGGVFGLELNHGQQHTTWGLSRDNRPLSWVTEQQGLQEALDIFAVDNLKMELLTTDDWVVASNGQISPLVEERSVWGRIFVDLLAQNSQGSVSTESSPLGLEQSWSLGGDPPALRTEIPVAISGLVVGSLRIDGSLEDFLQVYTVALKRFLLISLGFFVLVALALFAYSSWLSWRVSQLSRWTRSLVDERGQVNDQFAASSAADEIGELSRAYADLTQRLKKHTDYLQGLAGRLSHEIRTPLTIIGSSLENLEHASDADERQTYIGRAKQGLERLRSLLRRMSEVATLEAGIESTQRQNFDPDKVISELVAGYRQSFSDHVLDYQRRNDGPPSRINGVPDLLAQLVDKLVENALSFAPQGSTISLESKPVAGSWQLEVSNPGPPLPEDTESDIFSSMVSLRSRDSDGTPHLGLGLTIVKRITEFHQGVISAHSWEDKGGVTFRLSLPRDTIRTSS